MAVSGLIMILFLIAHMLGNLHAFQGPAAFNGYAHFLRTIGEPAFPNRVILTLIEVIIGVSVIAHFLSAFLLWKRARDARPVRYVAGRRAIQQSYSSRTMRWGGVIVLAFIVYHLLDMSTGNISPAGVHSTPYGRLIAGFTNPWVTAWYVIALVLLGMHLRHGIWSVVQTLGQSTRRREVGANVVATATAVVLTAGFLVVPGCIAFGFVR